MKEFKISEGVNKKASMTTCRHFERGTSVAKTGDVGWGQTEDLVCLFEELELHMKAAEV